VVNSSQPATSSRRAPSVLSFPVGDHMPEGRWASACSLSCTLLGVNETRKVMDSPFKIGADVCVAHVGSAAATMGPGNATFQADQALKRAVLSMNVERGRSVSRLPEPIVTYKSHAAQEGTRPHCVTVVSAKSHARAVRVRERAVSLTVLKSSREVQRSSLFSSVRRG